MMEGESKLSREQLSESSRNSCACAPTADESGAACSARGPPYFTAVCNVLIKGGSVNEGEKGKENGRKIERTNAS